MEKLRKKSGAIDASIIKKKNIPELEEIISSMEDTIKDTDTLVKENAKRKQFLT